MSQQQSNHMGTITDLPTDLLKMPPRFRLFRDRPPSVFSRLFRKIGGSIAYRFYW